MTSANTEDQGNPNPGKYKEAASGLFRAVSLGHPTTATGFENALQKFLDGTAPAMKKAPILFPEFTAEPATPGVRKCRYIYVQRVVFGIQNQPYEKAIGL